MINIKYPESLANTLRLIGKDFTSELKANSLVKLYEPGKVSSGVTANVLGVTRLDFLELLTKYNVSILGKYDTDDLNEDIPNALNFCFKYHADYITTVTLNRKD